MTGTTSAVGFKWLDILEKEFDKSYVGLGGHLETTMNIMRDETSPEEAVQAYEAQRKLLSNMAQCFVQLTHKSQTIAQSNAKLEAELIHAREEMTKATANSAKADAEKNYLICCLQSALLENHRLKALRTDSRSGGQENGGSDQPIGDEDAICSGIQMRLASEMAAIQKVDWNAKRLDAKCSTLERDLERSKQRGVELESELVGARLDAKYLDKELAGRIQQIQILLATNTTQDHKQRVWSQIESEMHLQRSKTISNMCYSKQKVREGGGGGSSSKSSASSQTSDNKKTANGDTTHHGDSRLKQVHLHKHDSDELGMAILGGKEHGLPIIISEVFPNSSVSRSGKITAGDVIRAVNGESFEEFSHNDAVGYLSSLRGMIRFELENTIEADIDKVCDMDSRYYDFHQPTEAVDDEEESERPASSASQNSRHQQHRSTPVPTVHGEQPASPSSQKIAGLKPAPKAQATTPKDVSPDLPKVHTSPTKKPADV